MKVFVGEYIHPDALARLKEKAEVVDTLDHPEELDGMLIRTVDVPRALMEKAKKCKVIGKHGVGYNTIDVEAAKELGIQVVYTPKANANSVAELIVSLILNVSRNISLANAKVRKSEFTKVGPVEIKGIELEGKTIGLIGMGNIAQIVGRILKNGFQMKVIGYDPFVTPEKAEELGIPKYETVKELIQNADIVNVSVPLTPATTNLIAKEELDCFKKDGILINAARGGIVNEDDLYDALKTGKLRGAACDVFVKEPPTAETKLVELENFCATPHIGANTEEALYRTGMTVVEDIIAVIEGKKPQFPVF